MEKNINIDTQKKVRLNEEINLLDLFDMLWKDKVTILIITFILSLMSVIYSLSISDIYRSEASLAPVSSDDSSSNNPLSQLGGLAGFAGISINNKIDKTALGIEVLKSRKFFNELNEKYKMLLPLMASKDWDRESNSLIFNSTLYDNKNNKWISEEKKPSLQEAYLEFNNKFSVSQDESGVINVSMDHHSPYIARDWLNSIIIEINMTSRNEDIIQAERSIAYLNKQLELTKLSEVREGLSQLLKSQVEKVMLINSSSEYLFKIIDPPFVPEEKIKPSRALICILGFFLGIILGSILVLIKNLSFNKKR
jgi:uncharacterized protein involved in exopolysaccharide biosynthesis